MRTAGILLLLALVSLESHALEKLGSPASAGASSPFLATTKDGVLLSWLEPFPKSDRTALRFSRFRDGSWSVPGIIVARNDLFVNWADFPSVVEDAQGVLFAHWLQKSSAGTYSYDIRMSISRDGKTWSAPFLLNRDGKQTEHGFVTLASLPGGGVGATWLDGRKMKAGEHEHDAGDMTLRYAVIDAAGKIAFDGELDARVCECCATGMAISASGPVIVYRDRTRDEVRDISYISRTNSGWTKPRAVHHDGWKINGCPVNGPQADAIGNRAVTAWFTAAQERGRAYVAFSNDGGTTFAKPIPIDGGKPVGRLDVVLLDRDSAVVTWLEQTATGAEIRARRVHADGRAEAPIRVAESSTARAAGFARIARSGRDVYFTWTEQSADSKRVHVARRRF